MFWCKKGKEARERERTFVHNDYINDLQHDDLRNVFRVTDMTPDRRTALFIRTRKTQFANALNIIVSSNVLLLVKRSENNKIGRYKLLFDVTVS